MNDGDIIGVCSSGVVSGIINATTLGIPGRGISHVGIVSRHHGSFLVFESTTFPRPPCAVFNKKVKGCQAHRIEDFLKFEHKAIWHYPLRSELYLHEKERLSDLLHHDLGTPYDLVGAVRSGGVCFRLLQSILRAEDLSNIFCSEWQASNLVEVGRFRTRNVSSWSPNRLCRTLVRDGICDRPRRLA